MGKINPFNKLKQSVGEQVVRLATMRLILTFLGTHIAIYPKWRILGRA
jgi:hypothetical protein